MDKTENRASNRGLPAPGLTNKPKGLAPLNPEAHSINRLHDFSRLAEEAAAGMVMNPKVTRFQEDC